MKIARGTKRYGKACNSCGEDDPVTAKQWTGQRWLCDVCADEEVARLYRIHTPTTPESP